MSWNRKEFSSLEAAQRYARQKGLLTPNTDGQMLSDGLAVQERGGAASCPASGILRVESLSGNTFQILGGCGCYRAYTSVAQLTLTSSNQGTIPSLPWFVTDCNGVTIGPLAPYPVLLDAEKILGAWNWEDGIGANLITLDTAIAGSLDHTLGVDGAASLCPIDSGVGYLSSKAPRAIASASIGDYKQRSSSVFADTTSAKWSFAFWWKATDTVQDSCAQFTFDLNGVLVGYIEPRRIVMAGTIRNSPAAMRRPTGNFVVVTFDTGVAKIYIDGVLVDTWTTTASSITLDCIYYASQTTPNLVALGVSGGWLDHILVVKDVLSGSAITSLAAGNLPNAAGVLV